MKIYTLRETLESELYIACINYIKLIRSDLKDEKIYGFNIYSHGYDSGIYLAVATADSLLRRIGKLTVLEPPIPNIYLEICADEWEYIGFYAEVFDSIYEHLIKLNNTLCDGCEFEDETDCQEAKDYIGTVFPEVIIQVLEKLKKNKIFDDELFETDVFLGYQFADSGNDQVERYVQASERLNSSFWHNKVLNYQQHCLNLPAT